MQRKLHYTASAPGERGYGRNIDQKRTGTSKFYGDRGNSAPKNKQLASEFASREARKNYRPPPEDRGPAVGIAPMH
jgi:hypothetical protein